MMLAWLKAYPHKFFTGFILAYGGILFFFPLQLQAVESYMYAAGAEGYYNLASTFNAVQPFVHLPDFSRFHPNHPPLHWLAGFLFEKFATPAFSVFRFFNVAGAVVSLIFFYALCSRLMRQPLVVAATTALFAFSHGFWMAALSGEVYLPSLACLLAASYYLVIYLDQPETAGMTLLLRAGIFFTFAVIFHAYAMLAAIPAAAAILGHARSWQRIRWYLIVLGMILTGVLIFYVLLPVIILKLDSTDRYLSTMLIYKNLPRATQPGLGWLEFIWKASLHVVVPGFGVFHNALKAFGGLLFLAGFGIFFRSGFSTAHKLFLLGWPAIFFGFTMFFQGRAEGINSWLFPLPAACLAAGHVLSWFLTRKLLGIILWLPAILAAGTTFFAAVLPNALLPRQSFMYLPDPGQLAALNLSAAQPIGKDFPIGFALYDPVLTFPEIWETGSHLGFRNQTIFLFCCGEKDAETRLRDWTRSQPRFMLVTDALQDKPADVIIQGGRRLRLVWEMSGEIQPVWIPSSVYFIRPKGQWIQKRIRVYMADEHA